MAAWVVDAAAKTALESGLHKARLRIIPLLAIGYLIAFMDRANISFAAESMNRQLHFSAQVYGLGSGLFFISYALCEIPSNKLLLRFGARRWLARIMLTWGLLAATMVLVLTAHEFYGARLLLGCAEAGYFPGVIYYLSQWFPKAKRAQAISWFYIAWPLSNVFMGLVAGSLLHLDGLLGLRGWQWLFLVEALPALLMSAWFWRSLPQGPQTAAWLTEPERAAIAQELAEDDVETGRGGRASLRQVLREPRVWLLGLYNFCTLATYYAVIFFLPEIAYGLTGWTIQRIGFLIAACGVLAAVGMVWNASHSDQRGERRWHVVVPVLAGGAMLLLAGVHLEGMVAAALLLAMGVVFAWKEGPLLVLVSQVCPGENAALAIATFNTIGIFGGFVGPYWMGWMRGLTGGYAVGIGTLCVPCAVGAGCIVWMTRKTPVAALPVEAV